MVRCYCTSGLLYFTSQQRVKYSPQVQCLTILHSSSCNDKRPGSSYGGVDHYIGCEYSHADVSISVRDWAFGDWTLV